MGIKILKQYQTDAVEELINYSEKLLRKNREKQTIVFQSPTGSGKTFMMGSFMEQLINEMPNEDLCFLWISIGVGELHKQSYNSLKNNYNGFPDVYLLEEEFFGSRQTINKNEVVVVNWDKLNQKDRKTNEWKSTLMKDKESTNFRELVKNTKESGTKIILIIDESHTNSTSERAKDIRDNIINADLTIELSATPVLTEGEYQQKVKVEPLDVIEEGMIKKEIVINDHIDLTTDDELTTQELILQSALNQKIKISQLYKEENIKVNPLVLIQIPTGEEGEDKKEFIESFLAKNDITKENGKLAIWLSEEKINQEVLSNNTNEVEFLIFKQAISTGWDCPRAQILVRFREVKSIVFNIQVVGRILRMPEARHYKHDELNKAFVYVNTNKFDVILNMEIVEHVNDIDFFIKESSKLLKKNGIMFIATLNKTLKSYIFAIIGAEYVLKWLPIGTHDWEKFVKPEDLTEISKRNKLLLKKLDGMQFNILNSSWKVSDDTSVNYITKFIKT